MQALIGFAWPALLSSELTTWMEIGFAWLGAACFLRGRLPLQNIIVATLVLAATRFAVGLVVGQFGKPAEIPNHKLVLELRAGLEWSTVVLACRCLAGAILSACADSSRRGIGQWLLAGWLATGTVLLLWRVFGNFPPALGAAGVRSATAVVGFEFSLVLLGLVLATPWLVKARPAEAFRSETAAGVRKVGR